MIGKEQTPIAIDCIKGKGVSPTTFRPHDTSVGGVKLTIPIALAIPHSTLARRVRRNQPRGK